MHWRPQAGAGQLLMVRERGDRIQLGSPLLSYDKPFHISLPSSPVHMCYMTKVYWPHRSQTSGCRANLMVPGLRGVTQAGTLL